MVPKDGGFNQSKTLAHYVRAHCDVFQARLALTRDSKVLQTPYFCHHGDTICHPKSGYVTTKLHETSTCGCNAICSDR